MPPDGVPLGTLCVIDTKPRPAGLTSDQANSLEALGRQVMMQMELRRSAAEKDLLVQEAHHRVKNSLQMVQSLLTLQAKATTHPQAAQQLRESAARVLSFAAMHENLYRVGASPKLNLAEYLGSLMMEQKHALSSMLVERDITFDATEAYWPSTDAPSIGLIAIELVTNALKYGRGAVVVRLRKEGDEIVLTVEDDGDGMPPEFEPSASKGLGMRILTGLLQGRGGRLSIDRARTQTCFIAMLPARNNVAGAKSPPLRGAYLVRRSSLPVTINASRLQNRSKSAKG